MKNLNLIPKITLWVLLALGIVASVMFYAGGNEAEGLEVAGDMLNVPVFTNLFLNWNYILLCLAICVTIVAVIAAFMLRFKMDKKKALASLAVVCGFVLLAIVCWVLGSPEKVNIIGYEGTDNVGAMAQMSDAIMYMTYILLAGVICTICWGAIYTRIKK
ncbi:MAG: hypothetical protein IJV55_06960 [Paludibacteraceae bacterium]|nr:hypothetical protein [Paludibacteraceae bacterium]